MDGSGLFGAERVRDVVLQKFAGAPARDIEEAVVEGEVDVGDQGRHGLEALEQRRQLLGIGRLGRDLDHLTGLPGGAVLVPGPDRRAQILQTGHDTDEAVRLAGIVRRTQFEHHLLFRAQVDHLAMAALRQVPDVQLMAVAAFQ